MRVLGYVRCSTGEQDLDAQRHALLNECNRRNWELVEIIDDAGYSARDLKRPGVTVALDALKEGVYDALMVTKLDRLSRSLIDFTNIMARSQAEGWALVALDLNVDTTTPAGEAMANVLATFAQFERRLIGQRTREGLAERKRQGVILGRPAKLHPDLVEDIQIARQDGISYQRIADDLNNRSIPTSQGGKKWWPSTVRQICERGSEMETAKA